MTESSSSQHRETPQQPASGGLLSDLRRLRRARDGRLLGGVCTGLGRQLRIDPVVLRVLLAVMVFFGGSGLLVYAAAWLLVPEEGTDLSVLERHLGRRPNGAPDKAVVIGGVVLLLLVIGSVPWWGWGFSWHPAALLVLAGAGLYLLLRRQHGEDPESGSGVPPPGTGAPPEGFESWLGEQRGAAGGPGGHGEPGSGGPSSPPGPGPLGDPGGQPGIPAGSPAGAPEEAGSAGRPDQAGTVPLGQPGSRPPGRPGTPTGRPGTGATGSGPAPPPLGPGGPGGPGAAPPAAGSPPGGPPRSGPATSPLTQGPQPGNRPVTVRLTGSWRDARPQPPAFWNHPDPLGLEAGEPPLPQPPGPHMLPPVRRPPRSKLFWVTSACTLIALGVLGAADTGYDILPAAYLAVALGVVGLGLVVGAWVGRSPGLVVTGILLAVALVPATVGEQILGEGAGPRTERATSIDEIARSYEHGAGDFTLDLSRVRFTDADAVTTSMNSGAGNIDVLVPPGVDVTVEAEVGFGSVDVLGERTDQPGGNTTVTDVGRDGPGGGELSVQIDLGAGDLEVRRG